MRKEKLQRELNKANEALKRGMLVRLSYEYLIEVLIKEHPNPKGAFNNAIQAYPIFKERITDLADMLELDLGTDK